MTPYDELLGADGRIRPMWRELAADFAELGAGALGRVSARVRRLVDEDGITYTERGDGGAAQAPVPWQLDPVPLLVSVADWARLESGLTQRSRLLDALLTDIYGARRTITSGLLPAEIVFGHAGYLRAAHGIAVHGRHQLFVHGVDVSRWESGDFRVIADWTQAPSGAGYALADRRVVATAVPEVVEHSAPRPLTPFLRAMQTMLVDAAPAGAADLPTVVVLSPGSYSETAFDQAYLASVLGFPLVESADLVVRDGALWMRSLGTLERVDVVLRRVDADYVDPLDLRPDSQLGVVGLVEVLRRGAVTVVNTLGSGILESPALANFLPGLARALLEEDLVLPSAPSWWGGDPAQQSHLLANIGKLTMRSAVTGERVDPGLPDLAARIKANGWQWVGQEPPQYATAPAVDAVRLTSAPVAMRLFSVADHTGYTTLPGGLGQLLQYNEDGFAEAVAAKDVWVRASTPAAAAHAQPAPHAMLRFRAPNVDGASSPRVLGELYWMGRYGERADATARALIVVDHLYRDYHYRPWLDDAEVLPVMVGALAALTGESATDLMSLTADKKRVGSLAYAMARYRRAASAVRDQLSHDTWMVLSDIDRALSGIGETSISATCSEVLVGTLALSGVDAESMVRDSGWYAMDIGKRIERGLALISLLRATMLSGSRPAESAVLEAVLRTAESAVTYRRRHHDSPRVAAVAQLLLFDAANPRSLAYQLVTIGTNLAALPGMSGSTRPQRLAAEASAVLRRTDPADLEATDADGVRATLGELLDQQAVLLRAVSSSFEATKLSQPGPIQPLWGTPKDAA